MKLRELEVIEYTWDGEYCQFIAKYTGDLPKYGDKVTLCITENTKFEEVKH